MVCPKCNQIMPEGSRFCQACGSPLVPEVQPETTYTEPVQPEIPHVEPVQPETLYTEPVQPETPYTEAVQPEIPHVEPVQPETLYTEPVQPETPYTEAVQPETPYAQPVQSETPYVEQPAMGNPYAEPVGMSAPVGPTVVKKGISKPVLFGIIGGSVFLVAALITLAIVFLIVGGKTQLNLQDYTEFSFSGVEGRGVATASIDENKLVIDMAKAKGIDENTLKSMDDISDLLTSDEVAELWAMYSFATEIRVTLDKSENLKNGDVVTATYMFSSERADDLGFEFLSGSASQTVSGLEQVREIDPFDFLTVTFEGTSPNAYVVLQAASSEAVFSQIWFEADRVDGLKLGDEVKVVVKGYDEKSFADTYGVTFTKTESAYPVTDVDAYITDDAELDQPLLEILQRTTEDYILTYFGDQNRADAVKASDLKYEGYYLLISKDQSGWFGYNKVYMIYSATVKSKEKKKQFKPTKVYFPVEYDDVNKKSNGDYQVNTEYKNILGSTNLKYGYWETVNGYLSEKDMRSELIDADSEAYEGKAYGNLK